MSIDLLAAADTGDLEKVNRLLAQGCDPKFRNDDQVTALLLAAAAGHADIVDTLLKAGTRPDNHPAYGYAPLHAAILGSHVMVVEQLLKAGVKLETHMYRHKQYHRQTHALAPGLGNPRPLHLAVLQPVTRITQLLLDAGADPHGKCQGQLPGGVFTPLHLAAAPCNLGDNETLKHLQVLLAHPGTDCELLNGTSNRGADSTPLQVASGRYGSAESVRILLKAGADVEAHKGRGRSPLEQAVASGQLESTQLLLEAGAVIPTDILHKVVRGQTEMVTLLLASGADVNGTDDHSQQTALHQAAAWGYEDAARCLLAAGAAVNAVDHRGNTPLHLATEAGHVELRLLLTGYGADHKQTNTDGYSPDDWMEQGRLTTVHAPRTVRLYQEWARDHQLTVSDMVSAAMELYMQLNAEQGVHRQQAAEFPVAKAVTVLKGDSYTDHLVNLLYPLETERLIAILREARDKAAQTVDSFFLIGCQLMEQPGPDRGELVRGDDAYCRGVLAAGVLWLKLRIQSEVALDDFKPPLPQCVARLYRMTEDLTDRMQMYIVITTLLAETVDDVVHANSREILDDLWERAAADQI